MSHFSLSVGYDPGKGNWLCVRSVTSHELHCPLQGGKVKGDLRSFFTGYHQKKQALDYSTLMRSKSPKGSKPHYAYYAAAPLNGLCPAAQAIPNISA